MFYRALRYGFARCSHALCADVLPTFSKVGARTALAKKTAFLLLAVCFSILRKQMTTVRQARKGGACLVKEKAAKWLCY